MYSFCPVCGYAGLSRPLELDDICPCCGTQFSYHDATLSHAELRQEWIAKGMRWHSRVRSKPPNWDPVAQLKRAGFAPK